MKTKKILILAYYLTFLSILAMQIVGTVYQFSQNISYGAKIATLQREKQELIHRKQEVQKDLSQKISLANFELEDNNFKQITKTITVLHKTTMASVDNP